jgi:hypothetical protein
MASQMLGVSVAFYKDFWESHDLKHVKYLFENLKKGQTFDKKQFSNICA